MNLLLLLPVALSGARGEKNYMFFTSSLDFCIFFIKLRAEKLRLAVFDSQI